MTPTALAIARAAVGLGQGLAFFLLYEAHAAKTWPATDSSTFATLIAVIAFAPLIIVAGLGNLRAWTLAAWTIVAAALCAGLVFHAAYGYPADEGPSAWVGPPPRMWVVLFATLFISHSLIAAGEADRRVIASYPRYFDVSWKHGLQFMLAALFVGVLWLLLWLGAELFRLIKIEFLAGLIARRWFAIPVSTLAFTCALHVTDVRAGIVRGTQTLTLTLLSWLLPVMTIMTIAFLAALPFTGLEPLWNTRHAASILLTTAAALIFLINATYQDGREDTPLLLRYAVSLAGLALVPLVALAGYALFLRVEQYGWTPQRILTLACIVVVACYAFGYAVAAARLGARSGWIDGTNIATAFVVLAVLLALFTPLADPARLSVADQVARLEAGKVTPAQFDFAFLRFGSGRYGEQALVRLKSKQDGPEAAEISRRANEALDWRNRWLAEQQQRTARVTPQARALNVTVIHPKGQALPERFLQQDWNALQGQWQIPRCLVANAACEAVLTDFDEDGTPEILLFNMPSGGATAFKFTANDKWIMLGAVINSHCPGVRDALRRGQISLVQPEWKELAVGGQRLRLDGTGCK